MNLADASRPGRHGVTSRALWALHGTAYKEPLRAKAAVLYFSPRSPRWGPTRKAVDDDGSISNTLAASYGTAYNLPPPAGVPGLSQELGGHRGGQRKSSH